MNFISSLRSTVTAYGNGKSAGRVNRSRPGCGMSVWIRGGRSCGWQNRTPRVFRAFGIRTGKRCLSTAASAPRPGRRAWLSGAGSQPGLFDRPRWRRSPVKTTADRAKIIYVRTERPGDPDDAITWQSSADMPRSRSHQCRAFGACVTAAHVVCKNAQAGLPGGRSAHRTGYDVHAHRNGCAKPVVWGAFTFVAAAQRRAENENEARQGDHPGAKQTMMRMHVELMLCIPPI